MYVKGLKRVLAEVELILSTHAKITFDEGGHVITVHTHGLMIDFDVYGTHLATRHYVINNDGVKTTETIKETLEETRIRLTMAGIIEG